jgi:hypothetical protein
VTVIPGRAEGANPQSSVFGVIVWVSAARPPHASQNRNNTKLQKE